MVAPEVLPKSEKLPVTTPLMSVPDGAVLLATIELSKVIDVDELRNTPPPAVVAELNAMVLFLTVSWPELLRKMPAPRAAILADMVQWTMLAVGEPRYRAPPPPLAVNV